MRMYKWIFPVVFLAFVGVSKAGIIKDINLVIDDKSADIKFRKDGKCEVIPFSLQGKTIELKIQNCKIGRSYSVPDRGIMKSLIIKPDGSDTYIKAVLKKKGKVSYEESEKTIEISLEEADYVVPKLEVSRIPGGEKLIMDFGAYPLKLSYEKKGSTVEVLVTGLKLKREKLSPDAKLVESVNVLPSRFYSKIRFNLRPGVEAVELVKRGTKIELNIYGKTLVSTSGELVKEKRTKLALHFTRADVRSVIKAITDAVGINVVFDPDVKGQVTISFKKPVYWKEALKAVLDPLGLTYIDYKDYISIVPKEKIVRQEVLEPVKTYILPLNYADAENVVKQIEKFVKGGKSRRKEVIEVNKETNSLILRVTESNYREIKQIVKAIDKPVKQVLVKAKIVQISTNAEEDLGFSWYVSAYGRLTNNQNSTYGAASYGFNVGDYTQLITPDTYMSLSNMPVGESTLALGILNPTQTVKVELALKALEIEGEANTISSPKVLTLDNQEASIEQGIEIPYTESTVAAGGTTSFNINFKKASLILKVKPHVTNDGHIIMDLEIRKDSPNYDYVAITGSNEPAIDTRNVKSKIKVKNGDTVVIGGIYEKEKQTSKSGVPVLSRIPLLGWLFKNEIVKTSNKKLLVFITPEIVK